jgi:hypothetical protein
LPLKEEHYPFWSKGSLNTVNEVKLFICSDKNSVSVRVAADAANEDQLNLDNTLRGLKVGKLHNVPLPAPVGNFSLFFDDNSITNL